MKKITILLLALSFSICSFAQIIKGVVSYDSIPLESASIIIKNSTKGVATNKDGEFKIEAKKGDTLSVSYLGYETKELAVLSNKYLNVKLKEGNYLNEVVIEAFSHTRKISCGVCFKVICIEESFNEKTPKLFPNPSSNGIFQLKLAKGFNNVKISVANINGQIIKNESHQKFGEKVTIDLSQFATGIYIVNIVADGKRLEPIKVVIS